MYETMAATAMALAAAILFCLFKEELFSPATRHFSLRGPAEFRLAEFGRTGAPTVSQSPNGTKRKKKSRKRAAYS